VAPVLASSDLTSLQGTKIAAAPDLMASRPAMLSAPTESSDVESVDPDDYDDSDAPREITAPGAQASDAVSTAAADLPNVPSAWPSPEDISSERSGSGISSGGSLQSMLPLKAGASPTGLDVVATRTADGTMFSFKQSSVPPAQPEAEGRASQVMEAGAGSGSKMEWRADAGMAAPSEGEAAAPQPPPQAEGAAQAQPSADQQAAHASPPPSPPLTTAAQEMSRMDAQADGDRAGTHGPTDAGVEGISEYGAEGEERRYKGQLDSAASTDEDFMVIQMEQEDAPVLAVPGDAEQLQGVPQVLGEESGTAVDAPSQAQPCEGFFTDVGAQCLLQAHSKLVPARLGTRVRAAVQVATRMQVHPLKRERRRRARLLLVGSRRSQTRVVRLLRTCQRAT
jgi:hypothetical protein